MTNQQVNVRPEQAADCAAVFAVNQRAFGQPDEAELIEALRASASPLVSLVAELDGEIVGHILFSPVSVRPAATKESPGPAASVQDGALVGLSGAVEYHPEFNRF